MPCGRGGIEMRLDRLFSKEQKGGPASEPLPEPVKLWWVGEA